MPKFFVDRNISDNETEIIITGADKHHMTDVLRIRAGEQIEVSDLSGRSFRCRLSSFDSEKAVLSIIERISVSKESGIFIRVFQGLPKSDKMEIIIRECTQLGACEIIPVICARSVSRFRDGKDITRKIERWQKIALEAAKQSGRDLVPLVSRPVDFKEAVMIASEAELKFLPWENENALNLKVFLRDHHIGAESVRGRPETVSFLTGPEGGFDASEISLAVSMGIETVTLGKRILRTETASPAVLAMLLYEFEM